LFVVLFVTGILLKLVTGFTEKRSGVTVGQSQDGVVAAIFSFGLKKKERNLFVLFLSPEP
jgi:hypothetical protein